MATNATCCINSVSVFYNVQCVSFLTKGGAGFRPWHRRHNDETKAFVLPATDLYIIGLQSGRHGGCGVEGLRRGGGSCGGDPSVPAASGPSAPAANAGGGAAAGADSVKGVLAALRGALPYLLRQTGSLVAAVVGGRRRWRHVSLCLCWRRQESI